MGIIRAVIVDDHPRMIKAVKEELEEAGDIQVVGTAANGDDLIKLVRDSQADVLVLDLGMPNFNPVLAVKRLRAVCPETRILVLTGYDDELWLMDVINSGAVGYVLKSDGLVNLAEAVHTVYLGKHFYSDEVMDKFFDARLVCEHVSDSDRMLLKLMAAGYTNEQIAQETGLAYRTVRKNSSELYQKMGVSDQECNPRIVAINKAYRLGLIKRDDLPKE